MALRLWLPLSDSAWLGGAPVQAPRVPLTSKALPPTLSASAAADALNGGVLQRLALATPESMATLATELLTRYHATFIDRGPLEALIKRWAEIAPQGAFAWWRSLPYNQRSELQAMLFHEWSKRDPHASELAQQTYQDSLQGISQPPELADLLDHNPAGALDLALTLPMGLCRAKAMERALLAMAKQDADAAFTKLVSLQATQDISGLAKTILGTLAGTDFTKATEALRFFPSGQLHEQALATLGFYMRLRSPNAALTWINQLTPGSDQGKALESYGTASDTLGHSLKVLFDTAAKSDPQMAVQLLATLQLSPRQSVHEAANGLYQGWKLTDPGAALKWAAAQPEGTFWPVDAAVYKRMSEQGADFLERLGVPESMNLNDALKKPNGLEIARAIGGSAGGSAWAAAQDVRHNNNHLNGKPALEAITAMPEDEFRSAVASKMAARLASTDPQASMSLIEMEGAHMDAGDMTSAATSLARSNPQATSQWLQAMPPSAQRDTIVEQLTPVVLADGDPAASFQWSLKMSDETKQLQLSAPAFAAWSLADPAAAAAALQAAPINDSLRSQLLKFTAP